MFRYKLAVEYVGTPFAGFQRQKNILTVQGVLENALSILTDNPITVCAGRTDAGVHAVAQIVHFDMKRNIEGYKLREAINSQLQKYPVSIVEAENLGENAEFHARFSAKGREYIYHIINQDYPPAIEKNRAWWIKRKINVEKMHNAAQILIGQHDFSSFRATGCQSNSPIKTINKINISKLNNKIEIFISAPSFLYHQVRNIVGTLILVGYEELNEEDFKKILEAKDRSKAKATAPAHGLYFLRAIY